MNRGALSFVFILLFSPLASAAISINEIMYDPVQDDNYNEWIEIYNNGTDAISLENWSLCDKKIMGGYVNRSGAIQRNSSLSIPATGFGLITDGGSGTEVYENFNVSENSVAFHVDASSLCNGALPNTNEKSLVLKDSGGTLIDNITYSPTWGANGNGKTLERNASGWFESTRIGGTPGAANSILFSGAPLNQTPNETQNITDNNEASNAIQNQEYPKAPDIEIMSAPLNLKFGDYSSIHAKFNSGSRSFGTARFVAYIYKPSWITKDLSINETTLRNSPYNSGAAAEIFGIEANQTTHIVLPVFVKCNDGAYANATYTARVRAYEYAGGEWKAIADVDKEMFVSGENEICKKETIKETVYANNASDKTCAEKIKILHQNALEINATYPEIVFIGENFTTTVFLKNNENVTRDLEIYSYIYEHSQVMSSGFDGRDWRNVRAANSRKVSIAPENRTTIELSSRARENASAEKYTYKIRIDDLNDDKNSEERIYLIDVAAQSPGNKTENYEIENISGENKITGAITAESPKLSFWDRIIYTIKAWLE
ncbi:Lamin Tail Domain protein [uncultured archaeon]|nr:Lamin Tail Domain protein [uncultured archaeon]